MRSGLRKKLDDLLILVEAKYRKHKYRKNAKTRLKRMNGGYKCDQEYKDIVLPFWKKYDYKPQKYWYQIYCDKDQKIDPRYIPDDLYYGELIPYFSNSLFRRFAEDKCYHDVWFSDIKRPRTIFKNIAGVFYDEDMNIISFDELIEICVKYNNEIIIKPSIDSGEGRLIEFYDTRKMDITAFTKMLDEMKCNYIGQEVVSQHEDLARLNPSSLNTIRIVSFLFNDAVHILSSILRVGAPNARIDNIGAGGYACPINKDGSLKEKAVNRKAEWVETNQDGLRFSDINIPFYDKVIETISHKHKKMPHFKIIGWDMSVDAEGNPIFIEYNTVPGSNQVSCGPTFGDITEEVLDEYFINKKLKDAQN